MRVYEVLTAAAALEERGAGGAGAMRSPGAASPTPSSSGRRTPSSASGELMPPAAALDLLDEVNVTAGRKLIESVVLMERLGKAAILSEGVLTFHSLPSLAPLPVQSHPALRGVTTFSLDHDELAGGGSPDVMHVCAIKKKTLHLLSVTKDGVTSLKNLPLPGGALLSVFRRGYVCIADAENYSIVNLDEASSIPLLPISQSPTEDNARPLSIASTSSTINPAGVDPRQRPAIACIEPNEFLVASHTGSTTLGVFVNERGEPCRGTLEWGSNVRSFVIDSPYVIALLHNNTIEVHSIITQEIVQVITLPTSPSPSGSSSPSPLSLQPRSLVRSWSGIEVGGATGDHKLDLVCIPLFRSPISRIDFEPPRTPTKQTPSGGAGSGSMMSPRRGAEEKERKGKRSRARTLLVGKNSLHVLAPLTLVAQVDALIEKGRVDEAVALAGQVESSMKGGVNENPELAYVFLRAAFISLEKTLFRDAFTLFLRSSCDPRLVVRMFPDLREPLIRPDEEVTICRGVQLEASEARTIDEYVLASLNRNYSPYMKPSVESASPTMELRSMLAITARDSLLVYLAKWRDARRSGTEGGSGDSRKVDIVVDTTLVRLLAENGKKAEILKILEGPNDCVLQQVEPTLLDVGMYQLLASVLLNRGEVSKVLHIWTQLVEGKFVDRTYTGGLTQIFELLWKSTDWPLVEKYGVWLIQRDRSLGLKLFTDSRQSHMFNTRELFMAIQRVDPDAADLFLESTVLQKRDTDSRLHADLVQRYIARLAELLVDPAVKSHLRAQESSYLNFLDASVTNAPTTFLSYLATQYDPVGTQADFDRVRLKTILFLATSANYDLIGMKKQLDEMELRGLQGLTIERAIVYGKLQLDRQALSLLLNPLRDITSSEAYCLQSGDPLLASDVVAAAARLSLPLPPPSRKKSSRKEGEAERKKSLGKLLVEICLVGAGKGPHVEGIRSSIPYAKEEQIAAILETQSINLDTLEVLSFLLSSSTSQSLTRPYIQILPLLPSSFPLQLLSPFLSRSLARSLHSRHEASLLKSLALSQNLFWTERLGDAQIKMGPTTQKTNPNLVASAAAAEKEKVALLEKAVDRIEREKGYDAGEVDDLGLK